MKIITIAAAILFASIFLFGVISFPDAPIYEKDEGYVGKYGAPHTRQDFENYRGWSRAAIAAFLTVFALNIKLMISESGKAKDKAA